MITIVDSKDFVSFYRTYTDVTKPSVFLFEIQKDEGDVDSWNLILEAIRKKTVKIMNT